MLSDHRSRDELQPQLAKALAVAELPLKLEQGWTSSSETEFYQFSLEIKSLQNEIAKAIWLIGESLKVRMKELKRLKLLLDPSADVSKASLRTTPKKMLTEYFYECSNLASIPRSLSKALLIINGNYRRTHLNEEIEEEVDCILSVSAQTKQIVWDLFPEHDFDDDYCDAYMEELEESDDGGEMVCSMSILSWHEGINCAMHGHYASFKKMAYNLSNPCTVMSLGGGASEEDGELIAKLFGSVGKIWSADEKLFDAVTGLSGSGPAYIYRSIGRWRSGCRFTSRSRTWSCLTSCVRCCFYGQ